MAFTQGVSGLNAAASNLDTIGNNIANSQTVGYKSSRTEFADIYAGAKAGLGVQVSGITQGFSTGSLTGTDRNLDVAINGGGFFRVTDGSQIMYSRNGQFQMSSDGYLVNGQGAQLTGYNVQNFNSLTTDPSVPTGGEPTAIQIPTDTLSAKATSAASGSVSLDAGSEVIDADFNTSDSSTYNWSTSSTVYDSLGNAQSMNLYFTKTAENSWEVNAQMPLGKEANLPTTLPSTDFEATGNGEYSFSKDGHDYIATVAGATSSDDGATWSGGQISYVEKLDPISLNFSSNGTLVNAGQDSKATGVPATSVSWSLNSQNGSAPTDFTFSFDGSSQTAKDFAANDLQQNGYASGDLTGIAIQKDGSIRGSYSNGQTVDVARIVLADFRNEQGLQSNGDNTWIETASSGQPLIGTAGTGQLGELLANTVEESNVDLSQELVSMIVAQRNYQANAQTIKTQDQVLQTLVTLR